MSELRSELRSEGAHRSVMGSTSSEDSTTGVHSQKKTLMDPKDSQASYLSNDGSKMVGGSSRPTTGSNLTDSSNAAGAGG